MQSVPLPNVTTPASALGFGCAGVMGRAGRRQSLEALHAAFEGGITFFDTARSYGQGDSESLLGEFLAGRRCQVVLSTKFGILPTRSSGFRRMLLPPARRAFSLVPGLRRAARRQIASSAEDGHFSAAEMQSSVEESLRQLRTDNLDLLFLHSAPAAILQQQELMAALEALVASGKVRRIGLSTTPHEVEAAAQVKHPAIRAYQFPCNFFESPSPEFLARSGVELIGNQPFGGKEFVGKLRRRLQALAADSATAATLREKLGAVDDAVLAEICLNAALAAGAQVTVASMLGANHVRRNLLAMEQCRFTPEELHRLRQAVQKSA